LAGIRVFLLAFLLLWRSLCRIILINLHSSMVDLHILASHGIKAVVDARRSVVVELRGDIEVEPAAGVVPIACGLVVLEAWTDIGRAHWHRLPFFLLTLSPPPGRRRSRLTIPISLSLLLLLFLDSRRQSCIILISGQTARQERSLSLGMKGIDGCRQLGGDRNGFVRSRR